MLQEEGGRGGGGGAQVLQGRDEGGVLRQGREGGLGLGLGGRGGGGGAEGLRICSSLESLIRRAQISEYSE